jgi:outer membrane receptor for ferrienterochelin and colicin
MPRVFFVLTCLFMMIKPNIGFAQTIRGMVTSSNKPIAGATITGVSFTFNTITDTTGSFQVVVADWPQTIQVHAVGYLSLTYTIRDTSFIRIRLQPAETMQEVIVNSGATSTLIADRNPIKTEQITKAELGKAACCDLAGCFETQSTVQPQTTNVLTNTKELRILGLSGVYNQVLLDGFPMIQGLTYTYGISSIPGTLVDNIYVAKGANSVLQGFESITGQINVETRDPDTSQRLYANLYVNRFLEKQFNLNWNSRIGSWTNLTAFHVVQPANRIDRDEDGFLDVSRLTRYQVFSKWKYGNDDEYGWQSRIGMRYLNEQRIGGQTTYNPKTDKGGTRVYGQHITFQQPEIWTKTGYCFNDQSTLMLFASAFHQRQESAFGSLLYNARQTNAYFNLQYEHTYGNHDVKTGISFRSLELDETIGFGDTTLGRSYAGRYLRSETIGGLFAENTMRFWDDRLTWIAGLRLDKHNAFGYTLTPRTLIKVDITNKTILRANVGTGWRTVNVFSENIPLLASSRNLLFEEPVLPERALNYGINLTQKFNLANDQVSGYISVDYYRTDFSRQFFPDYDVQPTQAIIRNFGGQSRSEGFQAEYNLAFLKRFEWRLGYTYLNVYRRTGNTTIILPFNPMHKVLTSFSYKPLSRRYHIDANVHWYGKQRLPDTKINPEPYRRPDYSDPFTVVNLQYTRTGKTVEWYVGCENIFDFRQLRPLLGWQDPFGPYFDTSAAWGPTRGREWYLGIRYTLHR